MSKSAANIVDWIAAKPARGAVLAVFAVALWLLYRQTSGALRRGGLIPRNAPDPSGLPAFDARNYALKLIGATEGTQIPYWGDMEARALVAEMAAFPDVRLIAVGAQMVRLKNRTLSEWLQKETSFEIPGFGLDEYDLLKNRLNILAL